MPFREATSHRDTPHPWHPRTEDVAAYCSGMDTHTDDAMPERGAQPPLTQMAHGAGCGCKLAPGLLADLLGRLPAGPQDDRILVGHDTLDDAGVYRLSDDTAVVGALDFFTPLVDDPETFGAIAATNAMSDVFAMGGEPLFGLAIAGYPKDGDLAVLEGIMRGGSEAAAREGFSLLGGHTIDDPEPKYGMAVIGRVDPDALTTNTAGRPGDVLVLTKPLGTGVAVAAAKNGVTGDAHATAVALMLRSNRDAAAAARAAGARCVTDVTGFGLVGHLRQLAVASGVGAVVRIDRVPPIFGVLELIADGHTPGAVDRNRAHFGQWIDFQGEIDPHAATLLFDPQTSGGLLIACPRERFEVLMHELRERGITGHPVGQLIPEPVGRIGVISPMPAAPATSDVGAV